MNVFYWYMNGASQAAIDQGEPLIDESLYIILDEGFRYMLDHPDAAYEDATKAGESRIVNGK